MTLKRKVLILHAAVATVILVTVGGLLYLRFQHDRLADLQREMSGELRHIDFALTSFMVEVDSDVTTLAANEQVRTRQDQDFTNYLDSTPEAFVYNPGPLEQTIIELFASYCLNHPYVNSVYMGRENGSFVRSPPRASPSMYDPRPRPWYILARDNPGTVAYTDPYPSLTTSDVNIGVVTALVDEQGQAYGVVGADVTLANLTEYLAGFKMGHGGEILLFNRNGTILANSDGALRFQPVSELLGAQSQAALHAPEGMLRFDAPSGAHRLYFTTSPHLGWKIAVAIPEAVIRSEVRSLVWPDLVVLMLALTLLSALTFAGLNRAVIRPLAQLDRVAQDIARTGDLHHTVEIHTQDEIGSLAASFNQMTANMQQAQMALRRERDLAEALKDAATTLTTTLDFEAVLDHVLEQVGRVVPNEASNFMLIVQGRARVVRCRGYERFGAETYMSQIEFPIDETLSFGQMISSKEPILVPDVAGLPGWQPLPETAWLRSYAATPIIVHDQVIGFLRVDSSAPHFFEAHHLGLLRTFASHAAIAIENARLYEQIKRDAVELEARIAAATQEIHRRAEELTVLNELSRRLTAHLSVEQVLIETQRGAARLLDAANCHLTLYDADRDRLTFALRVVDGAAAPPLPAQRGGLDDHLIRTRQPLLLSDRVLEGMAALGLQPAPCDLERAPRCMLGVPMVLGEQRVLGTIVVLNRAAEGVYQERDSDFLWALANQAAIAINNAQLYQQSEQHAVERGILYELSKDLGATLALGAMLQTVVDSVVRLVGADKALLVLVDEQNGSLRQVVGHGYDQAQLRAYTFEELQSGLSGWVLRETAAALSADLQNDKRNRGAARASARRSGDTSAAAAPLMIGQQVLGALTVVNGPAQRPFSEADLKLVTILARQAAAAIQKAQFYEAAQQADRLKSAFLASMSHELRMPLNSIIGFTGILLQGLVGPLNEEQEKQLGMVRHSARHLLALINDVLDISKIEAGELELARERFDVRQAVRQVEQTVAPLAADKGLRLLIDMSPAAGATVGDRRRFEQILINLANNAVKFTDAGEVCIKSEVADGWLVTRVTDTGIGIRSEDIDKLFKPFRQLDSGIARRHEGTGLGLSICDRLVTMMGGRIWVESQVGEGSTFTFTLPIGDDNAA